MHSSSNAQQMLSNVGHGVLSKTGCLSFRVALTESQATGQQHTCAMDPQGARCNKPGAA